MKLVKEHINEKFELESDPVHDMGIGLPIVHVKKWDILQNKEKIYAKRIGYPDAHVFANDYNEATTTVSLSYYWIVCDIKRRRHGEVFMILVPYSELDRAQIRMQEFKSFKLKLVLNSVWWISGTFDYATWDKYFKVNK